MEISVSIFHCVSDQAAFFSCTIFLLFKAEDFELTMVFTTALHLMVQFQPNRWKSHMSIMQKYWRIMFEIQETRSLGRRLEDLQSKFA